LELGINGATPTKSMNWFASYAYLDATFRDSFTAPSENHPEAVDGGILVEEGDRIPGIPRHLIKAGADYTIAPAFTLGGEVIYNSNQYLRGDESNQLDPIDGYSVVNLRGRYQINKHFSLFAKIDNLFDEEYETFGVLGEPDEVLGDDYEDPRFLGPGAPRSGWVGIEASF
jgi:outer membrane receptor protein involved in Fe transport